jgi:hypothetical protein
MRAALQRVMTVAVAMAERTGIGSPIGLFVQATIRASIT